MEITICFTGLQDRIMPLTGSKGALYVLGERELSSESLTGFYKIGVVKESEIRDVGKRISEHQTGNPREIVHVAEFEADFITSLEQYIHALYVLRRAKGEWFRFDETELHDLYQTIRSIIVERERIAPIVEEASRFAKQESNKQILTSTPEHEDLHKQILDISRNIEILKGKKESVKQSLMIEAGSAHEISGVLRMTTKYNAPAFSVTILKSSNKALYDAYLKQETKFSKTFVIEGKETLKEIDPTISEELKKTKEVIKGIEKEDDTPQSRNDIITKLHEEFLSIHCALSQAEWQYERLESAMISIIGECQGIAGICTWKEEEKNSNSFDKERFQTECPEEFGKYFTDGSTSISYSIELGRGY